VEADVLRVVKTIDDAIDLREWLGHQSVVALDTETTGINVYDPDFAVRTVQFGNCDEAWVVPFAPWVGVVNELLSRYDGEVLIHHAPFDVEALARQGVDIPWHAVTDTLIAMRLAEPHRSAGLKEASTRHVSASAGQGQTELARAMKKHRWTWATIPLDFPAYQFYAAMDVVLTARLRRSDACERGLRSPVYGLEMDLLPICTEMQRGGMRIDRAFCEHEVERLTDEITDLLDNAQDALGISLTSNEELGRWLLGHDAMLTHVTPTGRPSVSRDALDEAIARAEPGHVTVPVIRSALRVRKLTKLVSSYFTNFVEYSDYNGLLHPSIETVAARTGRMSIRSPALQTLPRVDDADLEATRVRQAVLPRDGDHVLVTCDYSQIELRLIAIYSGDADLQHAFHTADTEGGDFFLETTRAVYDDSTILKSDPRRNTVKTMWYASSYGAGIPKMAATAGVSVDAMRDVAEKVFTRYPGVKRLMRTCERIVRANDGWIETPAGRRIWVDPEFAYKGLNAFIQGQAADIFKRATVDMAHAGLSEFMVVPVHDEMLFSIPKDDVADALPVIRTMMTGQDHPVVGLPAEPSMPALTWADVVK
jgi:DNA polymerase-1